MKWFYPALFLTALGVFILAPIAVVRPTAALPTAVPSVDSPQKPPPSIRLKQNESGKIIELAAREYVFGSIAAEMPMTYSDEALKAQGIVAYTYALYHKAKSGEDHDLTDDPSTHQGYITRAEAMEKWGKRGEEYAKRLDSITAQIEGLALYWEDEPILAVCHDTSCGKTQNASDVWGGEYPYLVSVESAGDLLSPSFVSEKSFSAEDFAEICRKLGLSPEGDPEKWAAEAENYPSGTVKTQTLCGKKFKGTEIRAAFSLKSAAYDLRYSEDTGFTFSVRGSGHGVGLSQTGANYMALCGAKHPEILAWYFKGAEIKRVK